MYGLAGVVRRVEEPMTPAPFLSSRSASESDDVCLYGAG